MSNWQLTLSSGACNICILYLQMREEGEEEEFFLPLNFGRREGKGEGKDSELQAWAQSGTRTDRVVNSCTHIHTHTRGQRRKWRGRRWEEVFGV